MPTPHKSASYVQVNSDGNVISFVGPDAIELYRVNTIKAAMSLYINTGIKASRNYTVTNMLAAATRITHRAYPKSKAGLTIAIVDLDAWIKAMVVAIPFEKESN